jgi:DNA-binding Xre family transcriptional regulator
MISYQKLVKMLAEKGVTSYTVKKSGAIGQATWRKIHEGGHIDTRSINALCALLNCQPGDILEYVPDESPSSGV